MTESPDAARSSTPGNGRVDLPRRSEFRADDRGLADAAGSWKSAYIHIPFCSHRCPYCDFAIVDESQANEVDRQRYVDAVISEIAMEDPFGSLDSVNFGGGTPSLLTSDQLEQILNALKGRFTLTTGVEISIEVNPEDMDQRAIEGLVGRGFTRLSIGAQSFDGQVLGVLGREHGVGVAQDVAVEARSAGFESVGIDLIYGHPSESARSWRATVEQAIALPVDHISTYALTVERGTTLSRDVLAGAPAPDPDDQADRYEMFCDLAGNAGFARYEVSNHARPGHVCVYNLSTWSHGEYLGFGLGAHDHRRGERSRNHQRLDRYLEDIEGGIRPRIGSETLSVSDQERDRFMLGVRLAAGVALTPFATAFASSERGKRLIDAGIVDIESDRLVVTHPMLTDAVAREALSVSVGDC
ncbi:MAG: radical SAM family heme chaperone HemW [Actinomycetia bacterium]|nr:radical SAM family heme chaperone HemW [Actinomycetes bacterium]